MRRESMLGARLVQPEEVEEDGGGVGVETGEGVPRDGGFIAGLDGLFVELGVISDWTGFWTSDLMPRGAVESKSEVSVCKVWQPNIAALSDTKIK